jgi:hypothetical protein
MAVLDSNLRKQLERTVVSARATAESAANKALKRLGMHQHEPPSTLSPDERTFRRELEAHKSQLTNYQALVEQCAYEHWHRILFARFLAVNELLIHPTARVAVSLEDCNDAELQAEFGASDAYDLAARYAAQMLPAVFRLDDPVLRLKLAPEDKVALEKLVHELPEVVFKADDSLGWTYQFWQKERKEQVNKAEDAVEGSDISAVTQLFTEHYMVRFLLENTIGAWWAYQNPKTQLRRNWSYYKPDIPQDFSAFPDDLREVTFIDPCCGSGHFLVEAFLLFQSMYQEQGMSAAQAGDAAIENNIRGLELDPRCTQIAAFNLAFAAWRYGGFRPLPEMQIACSGLPLKGTSSTWEKLAGGNPTLVSSMKTLHRWFSNAQDLGSLISPPSIVTTPVEKRREGQVAFAGMIEEMQHSIALEAEARWQQVRELLISATEDEDNREAYFAGVRAQGIAKAAQMLSDRYWFVGTNPPFLDATSCGTELQAYLAEHYADTGKELCTAFVQRCRDFTQPLGLYALVTKQEWLFLKKYTRLRTRHLNEQRWLAVIRFGAGAFETISGEVMQAANLIFSNRAPTTNDMFFGLDLASFRGVPDKMRFLASATINTDLGTGAVTLEQLDQLKNHGSVLTLDNSSTHSSLGEFTNSLAGCKAGDNPRFVRQLWEVPSLGEAWEFHQSTTSGTEHFGGKSEIVFWEKERGQMAKLAESVKHLNHAAQNWLKGKPNWGKRGVIISQMGELYATLYQGDIHGEGCTSLVPYDPTHLPAMWCYLSSDQFNKDIRVFNQSLCVTNATFLRVPFELSYWQRVAKERYPDGLPEPYSDDPSQWLFRGDIPSSIYPLQVAVSRLLGYRWPEQPQGQLDRHTDEDGIVTLAPLVNQEGMAGRLRAILQAAYESPAPVRPKGAPEPNEPRIWNEAIIPNLLAKAGSTGMSFEDWLRDKFFEVHCKFFHQRPFIWHIWDGRKDGFHAYVNYHKLDKKNLERLTHVYLGEWIERQKAAADSGDKTADGRLAAAQELQRKLELIRTGEPPHDIFVRWKTLAEQPLGWEPDLNDGVRMNIRPFVEAGVLRGKVNVNWNKDRGKDPKPNVSGTVERHNDLHFTVAQKLEAREQAETQRRKPS